MNLRALIGRSDPRILILAVICGIGVLFSLFQAVKSLTGDDPSPEYRRSPPSAFALPLVDTIVDPQKLTEARLPDDAYLAIEEKTMDLSKRIAKRQLTARYLRQSGLGAAQADGVMRSLRSYYPIYAGRGAKPDTQISLGSVSGSAASTSQTISFGAGAGDAAAGSFTVDYEFSYSDQGWRLSRLTVNF